jgi:hypothetical protein
VPKNIFSPTLTILDVDEEEIARQLTLVSHEMLCAIRVRQQHWLFYIHSSYY